MSEPGESDVVCESCGEGVKDDDASCPHCGAIFTDLLMCDHHPETTASGVCVVCSVPGCELCGGTVNGRFLCNKHTRYEIREGMARVVVNMGPLRAQQASAYLEQEGLHPVMITDEEVFVPLPEALRAEQILNQPGLFYIE